jgi:DNA-binding MarR family transcriptional regulator
VLARWRAARSYDPPVPDDPIRSVQATLVVLGRMGSVLHDAIARELGEGLTGNDTIGTLFQLEVEGSMRPGQIQDLTGLSSGGVSKMLDRLEAAGLIVREYGVLPADRRASVVHITRRGRQTNRRVANAVLAVMGDVRVALKEIDAILG